MGNSKANLVEQTIWAFFIFLIVPVVFGTIIYFKNTNETNKYDKNIYAICSGEIETKNIVIKDVNTGNELEEIEYLVILEDRNDKNEPNKTIEVKKETYEVCKEYIKEKIYVK